MNSANEYNKKIVFKLSIRLTHTEYWIRKTFVNCSTIKKLKRKLNFARYFYFVSNEFGCRFGYLAIVMNNDFKSSVISNDFLINMRQLKRQSGPKPAQ